jgi:hypothetical protein
MRLNKPLVLTSRSNGGTPVSSRPWRTTRSQVGCSKPAIIRSVVVLPEPNGPSIEKNSPSRVDCDHVAGALLHSFRGELRRTPRRVRPKATTP